MRARILRRHLQKKPYFAVKFLISQCHLPLHRSTKKPSAAFRRTLVIWFGIEALCVFFATATERKSKRMKTGRR